MRIILDVMGGDNPPIEIIKGALLALNDNIGCDITLVGNETIIKEALCELDAQDDLFKIVNANEVVTMEDDPTSVLRGKKMSSMSIALNLLAQGEGDALVSCGNTGALFTGAVLIEKRIRGVRRAGLGIVFPYKSNVLLLDCGANINVLPDTLLEFALIGSIYMNKLYGIRNPRVGLVNNGVEEHKGTQTIQEARKILEKCDQINFIGSIEGKDIEFDVCDVAVCDGFTGNILLKTSEGMCKYVMELVTDKIGDDEETLKKLDDLYAKFDVTNYGAAPFLGISKPILKAHGNSNAHAIMSALYNAKAYAESDVIEQIEISINNSKK